jgi:hypothetical protein
MGKLLTHTYRPLITTLELLYGYAHNNMKELCDIFMDYLLPTFSHHLIQWGSYEKRAEIARALVGEWTDPYSAITMAADTTPQPMVRDVHYAKKGPEGMYDFPHKVWCKSITENRIFSDTSYSIEIPYHSEHAQGVPVRE